MYFCVVFGACLLIFGIRGGVVYGCLCGVRILIVCMYSRVVLGLFVVVFVVSLCWSGFLVCACCIFCFFFNVSAFIYI